MQRLLEGKNNRLLKLYPDKAKRIVELLDELSALEKEGETDIDRMSGIFGHIMEEILAYRQDEWERSLRKNRLLSWKIHLSSGCI